MKPRDIDNASAGELAQEERKWEQVEFHMKILEEIIKEYDTRLCMERTTFRWAMILAMILSASVGVVAGSLLTVLIP